ncbi:RNA-directed DNA polymerase, eukaryota [Tanacetum coccineum]
MSESLRGAADEVPRSIHVTLLCVQHQAEHRQTMWSVVLMLVSEIKSYLLTKEASGDFTVASVRKWIDDKRLPEVSTKTRWIKAMPIKVNVHAWKVRLDCLPTRLNISRRGIDIGYILCPICDTAVESSRHIFFNCNVAKESLRKIARWWDVSYMDVSSYDE